jgi:hypothetical protein
MPDPTPTPTPPPAPKAIHSRSEQNRGFLDEVDKSRKVAAAALDPDNTAALADVDFDVSLPGRIISLAAQIEASLGRVTGARASKKAVTDQESAARKALIAVLAPIQTAAKRKFAGDDLRLREAYYIGGDGLADETLEEVLTASRAILARLTPGPNSEPPQDVLPGIKADRQIAALADAIDLYGGKDQAQTDEQKKAAKLLEDTGAQVVTLTGLRHQVQLAADQAWPWRTPGVATIRKSFLLPVDRPFTVPGKQPNPPPVVT